MNCNWNGKYGTIVNVYTGNAGKFRDAKIALGPNSLNNNTDLDLQINQVTEIDPHEIQHLDCEVVADYKYQQVHDTIPIYIRQLQTTIVEDTGLHIYGKHMNGFPGAFVKYMIETMGVDGMQKEYGGQTAVFTSTVVARVNNVKYILNNVQSGTISTRPPSGENGYGFETIFIPTLSTYDNAEADTPQTKTLAEMSDDERLTYSPRSCGYRQVYNLIKSKM